MRIISWNCNMAFRNKAGHILRHEPDILIVPECEHPTKLRFEGNINPPQHSLWFGRNKNKGLGIFSFNGHRLKLRRTHNPQLRLIIPVSVTGGQEDITLYAIWANNPEDRGFQYVGQIWKALQHYDKHLGNKGTVLAGDFNSNTIWDRPRREGNHSDVVKRLEEKGIYSAYHLYHRQEQGKEIHPTQFMYRHKNKPYHIDYCFVSADLAARISAVEIGDFRTWTRLSDHMPVIVTICPGDIRGKEQ